MPIPAIDLAGHTILRLSGSDRQRYLNGQVSNDVRKLGADNAIPACVTTLKGKLGENTVQRYISDAYLIDCESELRESLHARLDKYIIADDCQLADVSDDWRIVHVLGEIENHHPLRRSARLGEPGTDLWLPVAEPAPAGLEFLSPADVESRRVRNGIPKWGAELTPDTLPAEAGLDLTAVDFHKGCYIGQEVISRIQSVGRVNRKLVRLRVLPNPELQTPNPQLPVPLFDGAKEVGKLTSVAGPDALGFVRRDHDRPGTRLTAGAPADHEKKNLSTCLEIVDSQLA